MGDKYFWLKQKDNFFEDDAIAWIEEQPNGTAYLVFYLKLYLRFMKRCGVCVREIGGNRMPYDLHQLARLADTDINTASMAMKLLMDTGLAELVEREIIEYCLDEAEKERQKEEIS